MKKCTSCDRESSDETKFCQFCGTKFPEGEVAAVSNNDNEYSSNNAPPLPNTSAYSNNANTSTQYTAPPPNNGLVWLIVSSVLTFLTCCCTPTGFLQIITIVISAISVSKYKKGEFEESKRLAKIAMIIFLCVLGLTIIATIIMVASGAFSNFADTYSEFYSEFY